MKNIIAIIVSLFIFACDLSSEHDPATYIEYQYNFTVSGDCSFITINDFIYHDLYFGIPFQRSGTIKIWSYNKEGFTFNWLIKKHTSDSTTISAILDVDGVIVSNQTTNTPYGEIVVNYALD